MRTLQNVIDSVPNIVDHLYNDVVAPHCRVSVTRTPVPLEFSNWRDEQRAWRETAVLFDQSHHMPELFLKGPDAERLLRELGVNTFANFAPGRAKQYVGCNARGQIIGDCILHMLEKDSYELVSGMTLLNWVHFQAEKRGYDVTIKRDNDTADNPTGKRTNFRFGMDGPNAGRIFDELLNGNAPEIPFFCTAKVKIAGVEVMALRHGMAGHKGVEMSGPYEASEVVLNAVLRAGKKYGLTRGGTRSYFSAGLESGWIGYPLPAIYTGNDMQNFREWLPASGWEANFQIGGSFKSSNIEDYYVTPYDMNYGGVVKFDHDFHGRPALEKMAVNPPRTKVTLVWNEGDVERIDTSLRDEIPFRYLERPVSDYAMAHADKVLTADGRFVGLSMHAGFTVNERKQISLAVIDRNYATPGTLVTIEWGEPDGGSRKVRVERHRQTIIRAMVAPVPFPKNLGQMKKATLTADGAR